MDTYSVMSIVSDPVKNMAMQITLLELTSFPLDMCQVVGLVVHTLVGFFLICGGNTMLFSIMNASFYICTNRYNNPFLSESSLTLVISLIYHFIIFIITGRRYHLIVV